MARIARHTVDQIYQRADIVDVVSDYVQLKRSGSNYIGLSPFKKEKTPSFTVSPAKNIFKDFSSGLGGNAISFLMEIEGVTYKEALERLAQRYHITLEYEGGQEQQADQTRRERLLGLLRFAAFFFQQQLLNEEEGRQRALTYLANRGYTNETLQLFQLGYSPQAWEAFLNYGQQHGYQTDEMLELGLVKRSEKRGTLYDGFRGRVIFPLHNERGRIVGFAGRILAEDAAVAKYINSPENELYDKSSLLYGLYFAKLAIRQQQRCFLVEGYTDVISLYQAGVKNVVASSGTSLTEQQVQLLGRYTNEIVLLYDGDEAGQQAAARSVALIVGQGLLPKVLLLPEGGDPDDYVWTYGAEGFRAFVNEAAQNFLDFQLQREQGEEDLQTPETKTRVLRRLAETVATIPDEVQRSIYTQYGAQQLGVAEQVFNKAVQDVVSQRQQQARRQARREDQRQQQPVAPEEPPREIRRTAPPQASPFYHQERELARVMLNYYDENLPSSGSVEPSEPLMDYLIRSLEELTFETPALETIRERLFRAWAQQESLPRDELINEHGENVRNEVVALLSEAEPLSPGWEQKSIPVIPHDHDLARVANQPLKFFKAYKVDRLVHQSQEQIQAAAQAGQAVDQLLERHQKLIELRRRIFEAFGTVVPPAKQYDNNITIHTTTPTSAASSSSPSASPDE